jgi:hypothetical protein
VAASRIPRRGVHVPAARPTGGTPRALRPIAEEVILLVARAREGVVDLTPDDLRRIELCALTALDVSMFRDLFGRE